MSGIAKEDAAPFSLHLGSRECGHQEKKALLGQPLLMSQCSLPHPPSHLGISPLILASITFDTSLSLQGLCPSCPSLPYSVSHSAYHP